MGRSAADLALGLDVLAGPAGDDAVAWRLELPPPRNGGRVEGLRVATWFDAPAPPLAADVRAALDRAASALADAGAEVTAVPAPVPLDDLLASWEQLVLPIATAGLPEDVFATIVQAADAPVVEDEPAAMRSLRAIALRHRDWLRADDRRQHHRRRFAELFERHDVLLAPVMPTAAPPHGDSQDITSRQVDVDGEMRPALDGLDWNGGIGTLLLPVAVPPIGRHARGAPGGCAGGRAAPARPDRGGGGRHPRAPAGWLRAAAAARRVTALQSVRKLGRRRCVPGRPRCVSTPGAAGHVAVLVST